MPVILITDEHIDRIRKALQTKGLPVENVSSMEGPSVESSITIFTRRQGTRFPVFLINE